MLADRLAIIDPTDFADLETLRQELVEVIEERLEGTRVVHVNSTHLGGGIAVILGKLVPLIPSNVCAELT